MKIAAAVLVLTFAACGGTVPRAPLVSCDNVPGSGDLSEDLLGSWALTRNAAAATYTFLGGGRFLSHAESDEPGADPSITGGSWTRQGSVVTVHWPNVSLDYAFEVDAMGLWHVIREGSDQDWRRCAVNADLT